MNIIFYLDCDKTFQSFWLARTCKRKTIYGLAPSSVENMLRFISSVKTHRPTERRALYFRVEARLFLTKGTEGQMEDFQRIEEPAGPL